MQHQVYIEAMVLYTRASVFTVFALVCTIIPDPALSFTSVGLSSVTSRSNTSDFSFHRSRLSLSAEDEEIARQVAKAKELLESVKAKMAAKEEATAAAAEAQNEEDKSDAEEAPAFFFGDIDTESRKKKIIKSIDESTGEVVADGELMATLSESEEWETRSLLDVFKSELKESDDPYTLANQQLASRDVAASIHNLKRQMNLGDFKKIFDPRNRFIGEN